MKKQSSNLFTSIGKTNLANLTIEVKETLAFGFVEPHIKSFTSADLWNIWRQGKTTTKRRFL